VPDAIFENSRLAEIYDNLEADRYDLDHYVAIVEEFGARSVLDVGCGTGTLAVRLALDGLDVTGVDPAEASLVVARRKPGADQVRWILGDTTGLPPMAVDLVLMTGNVAQVFVDDDAWHATLRSSYDALREGGGIVFEVRDPSFRGWEEWTPDASMSTTDTVYGPVESWVQLTRVDLPLVSFRWTFRFLDDAITLESDSTLRFRSQAEIVASLRAARFEVDDVRGAPDRPGRELVFIARRAS
jgi:SAM-dependent methyltransferase